VGEQRDSITISQASFHLLFIFVCLLVKKISVGSRDHSPVCMYTLILLFFVFYPVRVVLPRLFQNRIQFPVPLESVSHYFTTFFPLPFLSLSLLPRMSCVYFEIILLFVWPLIFSSLMRSLSYPNKVRD
jgi:hypothetical protein